MIVGVPTLGKHFQIYKIINYSVRIANRSDLLDVILDLFGFPEGLVAIHVWLVDVVVVVELAVSFNLKQMVVVQLLLLAAVLAQDVQLAAVVVDTLLARRCSLEKSDGVVGGGNIV